MTVQRDGLEKGESMGNKAVEGGKEALGLWKSLLERGRDDIEGILKRPVVG